MSTVSAVRTIVLWCPDWPVTAAARAHGLDASQPLALTDRGTVFACSAAARKEGVRRGLRIREAQSRCTELVVLAYDALLDQRIFEPVLTAIENIMPGVQPLRPGTCAIRAQGPSRYYGGEAQAAKVLLDALEAMGIGGAKVGIADGPFTAEQAARLSGAHATGIVAAGEAAAFLAPLPLAVLDRPELSSVLLRLGIRCLGDFAALPERDVLVRFGEDGARAHLLARGLDKTDVAPRTPPPQLEVAQDFEPPLDRIDQVTFAFRRSAEGFVAGLREAGLVCTGLKILMHTESGQVQERDWLHPRWFTADDVLDRVRWQLQGAGAVEQGLGSRITRVQVLPEAVDEAANHDEGLWGSAPEEGIHSGLSRVQSMLGHGAVLTALIAGGRMLADRRVLVPWGDAAPGGEAVIAAKRSRPWPGSLPGPSPATVYEQPQPVQVLDEDGSSVDVDERGLLSAPPARFCGTEGDKAGSADTVWHRVQSWAGPWPITERWWDAAGRRLHRFQLTDTEGGAWLLLLENHSWWAEASYD